VQWAQLIVKGQNHLSQSEPMWKREDGMGTQPMPTGAMYAGAMNKFTRSAQPSWSMCIS
jgi:hypothetical protein